MDDESPGQPPITGVYLAIAPPSRLQKIMDGSAVMDVSRSYSCAENLSWAADQQSVKGVARVLNAGRTPTSTAAMRIALWAELPDGAGYAVATVRAPLIVEVPGSADGFAPGEAEIPFMVSCSELEWRAAGQPVDVDPTLPIVTHVHVLIGDPPSDPYDRVSVDFWRQSRAGQVVLDAINPCRVSRKLACRALSNEDPSAGGAFSVSGNDIKHEYPGIVELGISSVNAGANAGFGDLTGNWITDLLRFKGKPPQILLCRPLPSGPVTFVLDSQIKRSVSTDTAACRPVLLANGTGVELTWEDGVQPPTWDDFVLTVMQR